MIDLASSSAAKTRTAIAGLLIAFAIVAIATTTAHATVSISRAELNGTRLRIEGSALPNRSITVDGVVLGVSDAARELQGRKGSVQKR